MKSITVKQLLKGLLFILLVIALCGCASTVPEGQGLVGNSSSATVVDTSKVSGESANKPEKLYYISVKYRETQVNVAAPASNAMVSAYIT